MSRERFGLLLSLLVVLSACSGGRRDRSDDGPSGGSPPLGGAGEGAAEQGGGGAGEPGEGGGGAPLEPGPAEGVCLAVDVAGLPAEFAPYETSCATTEPYACVEEFGCGYAGALEEPTGFAIRARLDVSAIDDWEAWPPAGARVGLGARTFGPTVTGVLKVAYGVLEDGGRGFIQETSDGGPPNVIGISFASLAEWPSPPTRDVLLCYDGLFLKGAFFVGPGITIEYEQPTPAGTDRVELLLEVEGLAGVDMLGRIEIVELEWFAFGERLCEDVTLF